MSPTVEKLRRLREKYRLKKREAITIVYHMDVLLEDLEEVQKGPRTLSTEEAGEYWGVTRKTVARWCSEGRVPDAFRSSADREDAPWRIPEEVVQGPPPPPPKDEDEKSALDQLKQRIGR